MKRHLAIFLPSLAGGGAEKVMLSLAERFVARGVRCDIVIAISSGALMDSVPDGIRLVELHCHKTIHATPALVRYLRRERPNTMLATIFSANLCALAATTIARTHVRIITCEASPTDIDVRTGHWLGTLLNRVAAKVLYPRADAIIAISRGVSHSLLAGGFAKAHQIRVIPNPIPATAAGSTPQWLLRIRDSGTPLIVACGRLEPEKNYPALLRAFSLVRNQLDATLIILGDGSLRNKLETLAEELHIFEKTIFAGFVHDPIAHMRACTLFAHSASYEGFGVVFIEALSCGLPIVATDCVGGVRDALAEGKYGTLVPTGDDTALADAILRILRGEVRLPDASEHLRQFDINFVAKSYLSILFPEHNL